ncbi:hypothetical protein ROHU_008881 [Labeo rohita]|uniref:Uncharacterized protein n=1 Tax=Labeo rohita TaxID=84645 RepID=A0A498M268_LABRO|nr:hypothetical protein ROHU_008881 [Labeo rohita]
MSLWYDGFRINRKSGALAERNGVHRSGYFVDSNFESFGPQLSTALSQPVAKQVYRFCGTKLFTQSRCWYEEVCKLRGPTGAENTLSMPPDEEPEGSDEPIP